MFILAEIYDAITSRTDFHGPDMTDDLIPTYVFRGGVSLPYHTFTPDDAGSLPAEAAERFVSDAPDYVVWAYNTPIAWYVTTDDRWVVVDDVHESYSNLVQSALGEVR